MPRTWPSLGLVIFLLQGCGSGLTPNVCPGPACSCSNLSCTCDPGTICRLGESTCAGPGCAFHCVDRNTCSGTCDGDCSTECKGGSKCTVTLGLNGNVSCDGESECTVTVGANGRVACTGGSTCHVTCRGGCSVTCGSSACDLTCPDNATKSIPSGGQCM